MRNWNKEDVLDFDYWLKNNMYGHVKFPVKELRAGYELNVVVHPNCHKTAVELVTQYDKEHVNG